MTRARRRRSRVAHGVLLALWCAAVWWLSDRSHPEDELGVHLRVPDKLAHAVEFAVGGFLAAGAAPARRPAAGWTAAVVFCAAWGTLDEVHQSRVPGRDASGADLAVDVLGAAVGALAWTARPWRERSDAPAASAVGGTP